MWLSADGKEKARLSEAADRLDSIRPERLDTYTVVERKDGYGFTLRHRDGRMFKDAMSFTPVPEEVQAQCLAAQLVTYSGKTYVAHWLSGESVNAWDSDRQWDTLDMEEREDAKRTYFTTPFGKRLSLYEDLYTLPEDPEKTRRKPALPAKASTWTNRTSSTSCNGWNLRTQRCYNLSKFIYFRYGIEARTCLLRKTIQ